MKNILIVLVVSLVAACGTKQPKAEDEGQRNPASSLSHANLTSDCAFCHDQEPKKPALDKAEATPIPHGENQPCETCHTWPQFANIKADQKDHNPKPSSCMGCHTRAVEASCHGPQGDCLACHSTTAWDPPTVKIELCK